MVFASFFGAPKTPKAGLLSRTSGIQNALNAPAISGISVPAFTADFEVDKVAQEKLLVRTKELYDQTQDNPKVESVKLSTSKIYFRSIYLFVPSCIREDAIAQPNDMRSTEHMDVPVVTLSMDLGLTLKQGLAQSKVMFQVPELDEKTF